MQTRVSGGKRERTPCGIGRRFTKSLGNAMPTGIFVCRGGINTLRCSDPLATDAVSLTAKVGAGFFVSERFLYLSVAD